MEEAGHKENLQDAVTLVQACKRKLTSVENRVRGNLENKFLQYPKSTLQQIRAIAKQLGWRKTWSECGSATCARRANDQALTIPNEMSRRLQGFFFWEGLYHFLCPWGPSENSHFTTLYSFDPFSQG